jgi:DNA-binding beta-propeller fold protein YncE
MLATAKMEAGAADALQGSISDGSGAGTIEVTLSHDERYVFATDEYGESMSVINLERLRAGDFSAHAYVGRVLLDPYPVGMALSSDGRYLYITSEHSAQATSQGETTPGTLSVVDVARAENAPSHAVVGHVIAGCSPVRVVLSSQGNLAWVTARGSNTLLAFKTSLLLTDPAHALIATIPVGPAPVGLILIRHDTQIVVANSNRFTTGKSPQTVMLVDVKRALSNSSAVLGSITVGNFPREMSLDGPTLLLTNYTSKTLSLIDLTKLP